MEEKSYSFTLIEILITTTIMIVLTGLSFAGYRYFNEQRKLEESTKRFVNNLELLKKSAIGGYKPLSAGGCGIWEGDFRVEIWRSTQRYRFGGAGSNDPLCILPLHTIQTNFYNDIDIIFSAINGVATYSIGSFDFKTFGSGLKANNSLGPAFAPLDAHGGFSVTLKNTKTNATKTVQVDRIGNITIQ